MCGNARELTGSRSGAVKGGYYYDARTFPFHVSPRQPSATRRDTTERRTADDWKRVHTDRTSSTYNLVRSRIDTAGEREVRSRPALCDSLRDARMD